MGGTCLFKSIKLIRKLSGIFHNEKPTFIVLEVQVNNTQTLCPPTEEYEISVKVLLYNIFELKENNDN